MLARMYQKRLKTYAKLGYEVYVTGGNEQSDQNILIEPANAVETLVEDIVGAAKSIFIAAPYASAACLAKLGDAIKGATARGIEFFIASTPREDASETLAKMNVEHAISSSRMFVCSDN